MEYSGFSVPSRPCPASLLHQQHLLPVPFHPVKSEMPSCLPLSEIQHDSRTRDVHKLPLEVDLSLIQAVETKKYLHQRRLSSTILSRQGMHFAISYLE